MALLKLQPRHLAFIAAYRANGWANRNHAYVTAGFKGKHPDRRAHQLANEPIVAAEIERQKAEDRAASKIDIKTIQDKLIDLERRARERNDLQNERGAVELQGKTISAFTDRVETNAGPTATDMDVVGKLAALIVQALASAGALAIPPNMAEAAIIAAMQGKPSKPNTAH